MTPTDPLPLASPSVFPRPHRRQLLGVLAGLGIGSAVFQRALAAQAEPAGKVTPEMVQQAEWIAGLKLTEEDHKALADSLTGSLRDFQALRAVPLPNHVPPALVFNPAPGQAPAIGPRGRVEPTSEAAPRKPDKDDDLAFLPLTALAALVRKREVTSVALTKLYLERLKKFDPVLKCVTSRTDDLALQQAEQADKEIAAGRYRGPLHGIPWGAKDLIAYPGYKTTWGAGHYQDQTLEGKATVARRLDEAGAVLVAKTTLGALAMGDQWFGGMTRNPWNPKQGSSGSSAGSASSVVAGLVGFAIGSETLGSIVSPCTRCGASGLRPTFGRVSRQGCMTLSWSMDKLGPIARSVEDCALVFGAIHGADGLDAAAVDRPFSWPCGRDVRDLRVGYVEGQGGMDRAELKVLKDLGVKLVAIKLPDKLPVSALRLILNVEAGTAFDELTRKGIKDGIGTWQRTFQRAQFVSAVEYLRAQRIRTLLMEEMNKMMDAVDLYVGGNDLLITNLTGHPTAVLPNGFRKTGDVETPTSITFTGRLFGETELLAVAHAYQQATGHHLKRPPMDKVTTENAGG
jgi:Asp-tRNA(Asn)/Glu-tRNA(Gln) amidotransferase A subunit family amidase